MGKTTKSAGTKSRTTAEYKVKKLTPRRITMITEFLTKTIDSPDNFGKFVGSVAWMEMLIEFLREPKRCRSTKMDILAWLKHGCFQELIGQVVRSAATRTEPWSGAMEQSISQVKVEPMSSGEDTDMQTLLPLGAIKTEVLEVEEEVEDQRGFEFEHADQMATGNQAEIWRLSAIKEEAEMITVKEELMLDDEFDEKLVGSVQSENQDPKVEIPIAELDQSLDLSLIRSAVAFRDEMIEGGRPDQVMGPEETLGDSSPGYNVPVSSKEIPIPNAQSVSQTCDGGDEDESTHLQSDEQKNQLQRRITFTRKVSVDIINTMSDTLISMVQDRQRKKDVSTDWDTICQSLKILKTVLKTIE